METLNVHYIWKLEIVRRRHLTKIVVYLSDIHISKLVYIVIGHLTYLTNLSRKLLRLYHKVVLTTNKLIEVKRLLSFALSMLNDVLDALVNFLRIFACCHLSLLSSINLFWHIHLLLGLLVLMLHLVLTVVHNQLVRYIYNSGCLIVGLHHIVIGSLIFIIVLLQGFIILIILLFIIIWRVLIIINVVLVIVGLITIIGLERICFHLTLLLRLIVTLVRGLEAGALGVDFCIVNFVDHLI